MRFKLDENLPTEVALDLRAAGHEADTVTDEGLAGADDSVLLARVQAEQRVFLTLDKGIADIRAYPPEQYAGVVLFRPDNTGRRGTLEFVRQHLPQLLRADFAGHLFVVSATGIRVR